MTDNSSATALREPALSPSRSGLAWGLLGVTAFSFTVPLTRVAVDGLSPLFIGAGRGAVAGLMAFAALLLTRQRLPNRAQWARAAVVAAGVVVGFPFLTSYALAGTPASHGAVVIGMLPAATAVMAVLRGHERPPRTFWIAAGLGAVATVAFAALQGLGGLHLADLLLFGAVVAAAVGYAEGGLLARELGAWQTVSWALVLAAPVMFGLTAVAIEAQPPSATPVQWASFAYLAVVSQNLGFLAWYRGLAIGPMTEVSQIQLVQPVMTLLWAALLLAEPLTWSTALGALAVVLFAALSVRSRRTSSAGGGPGPSRP
ncbi:DMT family transporter [Saccharopolyspora tripterygii]